MPFASSNIKNTNIIRPTASPETKWATWLYRGNVGNQYHRMTPQAIWRKSDMEMILFTPNGRTTLSSFSTTRGTRMIPSKQLLLKNAPYHQSDGVPEGRSVILFREPGGDVEEEVNHQDLSVHKNIL